jgi:endonuclease III
LQDEGVSRRKVANICRVLSSYYPETRLSNKKNPLLEAIFILLSSQTDEGKYIHTWRNFRAKYPRIEDAERASKKDIYKQIQGGGLGAWKAARIHKLLKTVKEKYGNLSLSSLKKLDNKGLEKELISLDGIGIKSARCIMMYSFNRHVFPIDTHALRIIKRIGFRVPNYSKRSRKFADFVQEQVPNKYRTALHIKLVQHGRKICKTKPHCGICPIIRSCERRF